jgi:hypothetical protein
LSGPPADLPGLLIHQHCSEERSETKAGKPMKPFTMLAAALFALIALAHVWRLATACEVVVSGTIVPMWVSWLGLVVAAGLAVMLWREGRR